MAQEELSHNSLPAKEFPRLRCFGRLEGFRIARIYGLEVSANDGAVGAVNSSP